MTLRRGQPPLGSGAQARRRDGLRLFGGSLRETCEEVPRGLGYVQINEDGRTVMQETSVFGASPRQYRTIFYIFAVDKNDRRSALGEFSDMTIVATLGGRALQYIGSRRCDCNLPSVGPGLKGIGLSLALGMSSI